MRKKTDDIPKNKKQYKWTNNYIAKAYDRVNLTMPKGEKEHIQEYLAAMREKEPEAEQYGSVNAFIMYAIRKVMSDSPL